jgi:hypothetical protein
MPRRCIKGLWHALGSLAILVVSPAIVPILYAQSSPAPASTNAAPPHASSLATTNSAPVSPSVPATNSAPTEEATNSAPLAPTAGLTNAAPGEPASSSSEMEQEQTPPSPGAMAAPTTELIGPPAPGSSNEPAGANPDESEGAMPGNNPAVQDVTNQPGAVAGLGQRRWPVYFGLDLGEMYDDNILIAPDSEKKGSFITHISPNIDYQQGDQSAPHMNYLNLYFAPTYYIYHNQYGYNRADYDGDIYYQYNWTRLSLGVEERYQHLTDATLDDGDLVSRNLYSTKIVGSYVYNDDLDLYSTVVQSINSYKDFTLNEWDFDNYALYQIAPKLSIGAGPRIAWLDIQGVPNETHEDFLFRLTYNPDKRLSVAFDGGLEYLQFEGNTPDRLLPVFDANATWSPIDGTSLFLSGTRATENSYDIRGDTIDYTSVQVGASQRFLEKFVVAASTGYSMSEYQQSSGTSGNTQREDNYYFAKGSLEWDPNEWLKVEASYRWSNQDSTFEQNTFTDNQIDLQSSVKF